jgi:Tfp pilus assembly protein PilV
MVSVLVAIVLLSAGVVVLSSSSLFITSIQTDAQTRSIASSIALGYMEEVKTRERTSLAPEEPVRVNAIGEPDESGKFVRRLMVDPEPSVVDAVKLAVWVRYPSGMGRWREIEVVTIIYVGT